MLEESTYTAVEYVHQVHAEERLKNREFQPSTCTSCMRSNSGDVSGFIPQKRRCLTPENMISIDITTASPDSYSYHSSHNDEYRCAFYQRQAQFYRLRDGGADDNASRESVSSVSFTGSETESIWEFEPSQLMMVGQGVVNNRENGYVPYEVILEESSDKGTLSKLNDPAVDAVLHAHVLEDHCCEVDSSTSGGERHHHFPTRVVHNRSQNTTCDSYSFHSSHSNAYDDDDRCLFYRANYDGNGGDNLYDGCVGEFVSYANVVVAVDDVHISPPELEWYSSKNCIHNDDNTVTFGLKENV